MSTQTLNEKRIKLLKYIIENKNKIIYKASVEIPEKVDRQGICEFKTEKYIFQFDNQLKLQFFDESWDTEGECYSYQHIVIDDIDFCFSDNTNREKTNVEVLFWQLTSILRDEMREVSLNEQRIELISKLDKVLNKIIKE